MEQRKIWDHYQVEHGGHDAFGASGARYRFLAGRISDGARVLNVGIGRGGLEALLVARGVEVYSLDPGESSIAALRSALAIGDRARVGKAEAMPFDSDAFDFVVMSEVLEHLTDREIDAALCEVRRVLRRGGQFLGTVPADEQLKENECVCPCCGAVFHRWGHVQSFGATDLKALLAGHFSRVEVQRRYFADSAHLNAKGRLESAAKRLALRIGVRGSNETLVFRASR